MIITKALTFYHCEQEFTGVVKIAQKVCQDCKQVFGPDFLSECSTTINNQKSGIQAQLIFGTIGKSQELETLATAGIINLEKIRDKREVYGFFVLDHKIVIAGSDKRGTIYGLFHLSELLGVSPLINWAQTVPARKSSFELTAEHTIISKEPSVRYRGFFINDEWPAFGNWANHNFGGLNASMYEQVFELLLRLKGNYLWPAMWASRFSDDGPGLANAELADELGVIMGASHHEPCCRAGEEYKHLRGPDSIYGDSWNFRANQDGITRFWQDGLKRNGRFENVITVGMRGEADTAILGKQASLKDNIDLLRDVISTQNRLIKANVNNDLQEVPRMLALYKEVEPYFYGDEHTQGLMDDPELEGVTLMLCDDNHGNLRTLPTESMRSHKGGYGMYYHFDYHGSPYSYEWLNTTYLPKVKEQMTMAYDFGIRELWVVNVGDIMTNEFPLSYFLDLAYDFDTYSKQQVTTSSYTETWVRHQFPTLSSENHAKISEIITGYTKLAHLRRTESLQPDTFHPQNFSEADLILAKAEAIIDQAEQLKKQLPENVYPSFFSQAYFPACGTMNVLRMQLLSGKNHWFARHGAIAANKYAQKVKECYNFDQKLITECDTVADGRWYAMGWSEHFGFTHWCEGENQYPVYMYVEPTRKQRLVVWAEGTSIATSGQEWTKKPLKVTSFRNPEKHRAIIYMADCSTSTPGISIALTSELDSGNQWLSHEVETDQEYGIHKLILSIDRDRLAKTSNPFQILYVNYEDGAGGKNSIEIQIDAEIPDLSFGSGTFIQTEDYISIEAKDFKEIHMGKTGRFEVLHGYGKTDSAVKAFPTWEYFTDPGTAPGVEYHFVPEKAGQYVIDFYMNPSNPVAKDNRLEFSYTLNDDQARLVAVVGPDFAVGDDQEPWSSDVSNNIRISRVQATCKTGLNKLNIQAVTPGFVLEKIVVFQEGTQLPESYLGPPKTFMT
ncbi:glycosyl hydrolase 115 family protein [Spirochaeta dissipatitropha]